jgi:hypothetical protein
MEVDEPQLVSRMIIETEDDDDDDNSIQAEDLAAEPLLTSDRAEPWHSQFSSSWIPMITRDVIRQQRQVMKRNVNSHSKLKFSCKSDPSKTFL